MTQRSEASSGFPSVAGPLLVWLGLQLVAFAMATARVKLWARFPAAGETLALDELLVVQFVGSSLLFPFLCRDFRCAIVIVFASLPFVALAGILSFAPTLNCAGSFLNLAIWLSALCVWVKVVEAKPNGATSTALNEARTLITVAIVSALNLAGPALAYFAFETRAPARWSVAIPLLAAVHLSHHPAGWDFLPALTILVLGVMVLLTTRGRFSTAQVH